MIFDKEDIPFFNELEKTNQVIRKDNIDYNLYSAPNWDIAQKVDAFMGNDELGFSIDDYIIEKSKEI